MATHRRAGAADPNNHHGREREGGSVNERQERRAKERSGGRRAAPTGRGGNLEALHHPGLGPNRVRLSDERRGRGHDHDGDEEPPSVSHTDDHRRQQQPSNRARQNRTTHKSPKSGP